MTAELVPLATLTSPAAIANLPVEERGHLITRALVGSKQWLAVATKGTDPTPLTEFKAWAATIAEMSKQKGLAEDIQLDALEMVRRAERGIGQAIRNGQQAGEIVKAGSIGGGTAAGTSGVVPDAARGQHLARPTDFVTANELSSNQAGIYALTDGVTDEDFEDVLDEARDEMNLSRANVARKARETREAREDRERFGWEPNVPEQKRSLGERIAQVRQLAESSHSSRQIAEIMGMGITSLRRFAIRHDITIPADAVIPDRTRKIDPTRVITQTVDALEGLAMGLQLLTTDDYASLDKAPLKEWTKSLTGSLSTVNHMKKEVARRARN